MMGLGLPLASDGVGCSTWDLATERGDPGTLSIALDRATGELTRADLDEAERTRPGEAW